VIKTRFIAKRYYGFFCKFLVLDVLSRSDRLFFIVFILVLSFYIFKAKAKAKAKASHFFMENKKIDLKNK